jgi:lactoylglutathione lyase
MNSTNILGLRTTIYKVGNIASAKEWYSKAFEVKPYFDEPFYVGFNVGGYELGLQPEEQTNVKKGDSVLSYWGVNNVDEAFNHLLRLGATEHEKPQNVGGEIIVATVKDPWKNIIGFIYNPEFKLSK